jgi:hypothetical protein
MLTLLPRAHRRPRTSRSSKDIELVVLRHEVAILRRTNPGPRLDWPTAPCSLHSSNACLRRYAGIDWVTPAAVLRCHRRLVANLGLSPSLIF